ncbi:MAG: carboxypeptidase-like regulatory domain-containing protein, partial [Gemmataceae bacterium]|nr:carboxypeptidase-like regulatory domain-containing protein [Gemmataceae bacterium]
DGRFTFDQVPAGRYELVVWHPNWATTGHERNPETGLVQRVSYAPPLEFTREVTATAGKVALANVTLPR